MKIVLKNMQKEERSVEVTGPQATVAELSQNAAAAFSADPSALTLVHLGNVLGDKSKTLAEVGIADGGLVIVVLKKAKPDTPAPASPAQAQAAVPPCNMESKAKASALLSLSVVHDSDVRLIEADSDETVENVKAILEVEFNIPLSRQLLTFEGKVLSNTSRLNEAGVKNNDMLMLDQQRAAPNPRPASAASRPQGNIGLDMLGSFFNPLQRFMREAEELIQLSTIDPHLKRRITENNAALGAALESGNAQNVAKELAEIHRLKAENEAKKQAAIMRLNSNPLDVEAQREIEDAIRMENIDKNLEQAMEYNPESFGRVVMLYIDCEVNSIPMKAFVDSGAQSTIMSLKCAERLGLMRLVDKRYAGVAKGVGTSKIVGRVHAVDMKIGSNYIPISITVLENNDMEFLFGLDNLRRHQCILDLKDNVLRIGGDSVPFLGEGDIPMHLRESETEPDPMETDSGASAGGGSGGGSAAAASAEFPQTAIDSLMGMGFTREQALMALRTTNGNPELAASLLFGGD